MPVQVIMPQFGESVNEGTITHWLKTVGDWVDEYEALVEINTDKVDAEVTSPASGVILEILIPEGQIAQAGTVLAAIGAPGEIPTSKIKTGGPAGDPRLLFQEDQEHAPAGEPRGSQPNKSGMEKPILPPVRMGRREGLGFISPLVAQMAEEHQVDLHRLTGSGLGGRITKQDLLDYLRAQPDTSRTAQGTTWEEPTSGFTEPEILPISPIRRRIAEHMESSKRTAPHVTTVMEADLKRVIDHREAHKGSYAAQGARLTFSAYFISAAASALKTFPIVNASWSEVGILMHQQINIGIAVALEEGLIVPVIRRAGELSLLGISQAVDDLAERARAKRLVPTEVQGGTFTITNHGVSGSLFATPIINQPQCAILGIGAIQKRAVVVEMDGQEAVAIRPMAYLSLTFDHRILDGATADHFLAKVVKSLQTWQE